MAKLEIKLPTLDRLSAINKIKEAHVKIGIDAEATYDTGGKKPPKVAEVAAYLEYGWTQRVSPAQSFWFSSQGVNVPPGATLRSPPRPFFEATYNANIEKWKQLGRQSLKGLAKDRAPLNKIAEALRLIGSVAQEDLQDAVQDGAVGGVQFARRSPLTMLLYGKQADAGGHRRDGTPNQTDTNKPLYRQGTLAGAIIYNVEGI